VLTEKMKKKKKKLISNIEAQTAFNLRTT